MSLDQVYFVPEETFSNLSVLNILIFVQQIGFTC